MNRKTTRPRIAYVTPLDPASKRSWSGTIFYMAKALERHCGEVVPIGPVDIGQFAGKAYSRLTRAIIGKRYDYSHAIRYAHACARFFEDRLRQEKHDVIFAPAASTAIAFLETDLPIVYASDVTFSLLNNYYPEFTDLLDRSVRNGNIIEGHALRRSAAVLFSSDWAARSAIDDYGADPSKVHVMPFGANLDQVPGRSVVLEHEQSGTCRLLFLAVSWERKGGEIARETLVELLRLGIDAELTVCGCVPPPGRDHERMRVIPFLNKNDELQSAELTGLLRDSDFLVLPTRFDCTPIVFCEANACGLPVVSTDTGGVPAVVRNGENGYLLPPAARGDAYAATIASVFRDGERFVSLRRSSRQAYDDRLNWDSWAEGVRNILENVLYTGTGRVQ